MIERDGFHREHLPLVVLAAALGGPVELEILFDRQIGFGLGCQKSLSFEFSSIPARQIPSRTHNQSGSQGQHAPRLEQCRRSPPRAYSSQASCSTHACSSL